MVTITAKVDVPDRMTKTSLAARVGATPLIELRKVTAALGTRVRVFAKAEWFNPSGSVKDRPALGILHAGLSDGSLRPGRRLLDSTSGNMGIAYATLGAALGIPCTLCVPESASPERLKILHALGAEIITTDGVEGSDGAMRVACAMAEDEPLRYWYANQYANPANWESHFRSTGPEIYAQTQGRVTHLVVGVGTSGTLMGAGRYLRQQLADVQLIGVEPETALHGLEGLKHMPTAERPSIFDAALLDGIERVETDAAHAMARELARTEGLFVGISSGASAVAALRVATHLRDGVVVTVFPDAGYKYLSDPVMWGQQ